MARKKAFAIPPGGSRTLLPPASYFGGPSTVPPAPIGKSERLPWEPRTCPEDFDSVAIADIRYDNAKREMTVEFQKGGVYVYSNVAPQKMTAFCAAPSKGRYFVYNVRNNYAFRRIG